jgi:Cellulase (glycosyl hydrolase family 5)/Glycoside hydrolase family 5 C-terminal domain
MTVQVSELIDNARLYNKEGRWFKDSKGRYVLFRGVNFGSRSKLAPFLPIAPLNVRDIKDLDLKKEIETVKPELDLLKHLGFNFIRLLISWKAIEPRPNSNLGEILPEGKRYLGYVKEIIDELYKRDLYVLLDFHQDIAHEIYGGDGFPDWALAIDSKHKKPKPSNLRDKKWQFAYMINKLVKNTLKSFWENNLTNTEAGLENYPVRTHLEKTIGQTVRFFSSHDMNDLQKQEESEKGHPAVIGVEPFNEPHPVGMKDFETNLLFQYYLNVNSEIRKYDDKIFLFIEPGVDWTLSERDDSMPKSISGPFNLKRTFNLGFVRNTMVEGKVLKKNIQTYLPKDPNSLEDLKNRSVLSFHYYEPMAILDSFAKIPDNIYRFKREWPDIFAQLVKAATDRDLIPFLTEFGAIQGGEQIREFVDLQFDQIESNLLDSTYWNYDLYNTVEGKDNWNLEDFSLLGPNRVPRNIEVMARPYPLRSSAEPTLLFFDIESKYAAIILSGNVIKDVPTIIYVPYHYHYSPNFKVWTTGGQMEWDKENQLVYWYPSTDKQTNLIVIGKDQELKAETLPEKVKELQDKITTVNSFS